MRVIIAKDYNEMSVWAANYVANRILEYQAEGHSRPFVLGCPTGSSPLGLYKQLIKLYEAGKISFANVVTFNMDEYVNLPEEHPESYHSFMWTNFFSHIDIKKENVHILNGNAQDLKAECANYEKMIEEAGGVDLFMAASVLTAILHLMNQDLRSQARRVLRHSPPTPFRQTAVSSTIMLISFQSRHSPLV